MSVLGLGLDLVEVEPFARQLALVGSSFAESTFTMGELARARAVDGPGSAAVARHLAARFAAKEAFVKAWSMARRGTPPAMDAVAWHDLEVVLDDWGRPSLLVGGPTLERLRETLGDVEVVLSMTHEDSVAGAVVVLAPADGEPRGVPAHSGATPAGRGVGG
jgi:holo-[acyl-carrier protein] synthase